MSRLTFRLFVSIASFAPVGLPAAASAATWKSCSQVLAKYPNGVARTKAAVNTAVALGFAKPSLQPKVYGAARKLDRFKDDTVCVTEANKRTALPGLAAPALTSANEPLVSGHPAVSSAMANAVANLGGTCVVAMKDSKIIGEWYSGGRTPTTKSLAFSSSKPVTAAVIGAALQLGRLSLDQSIADFIPEFKGTPKAAITIRHLMTHKSGLKSTNVELNRALGGTAGTLTAAALALPLTSTPGSTWDYETSGVAMQLLVRVVERAVGEKFTSFAEKYVLRPAGMVNSTYKGDDSTTGWSTGDPWLAGGLDTTCRDLARLGQLFQAKGQWAGQQIFSPQFAVEAVSVQASDVVFAMGGLNGTYGLLLNHNHGGIGHLGACGQQLLTVPSGTTIAMMSSSTLYTPSMAPQQCALTRLVQLTQATVAISTANF